MPGAQRPRRSLTSAKLRTWRDFIETVQALRLRLDGRLQSESSLSQGDYRVLLPLSEADGPRMRPSELAPSTGGERSRLPTPLGRRGKRGAVSRDPCRPDA